MRSLKFHETHNETANKFIILFNDWFSRKNKIVENSNMRYEKSINKIEHCLTIFFDINIIKSNNLRNFDYNDQFSWKQVSLET